MDKYIISLRTNKYLKNQMGGGATAKAPADILSLAKKAGYKELVIIDYFPNHKAIGYISFMLQAFGLAKKLKERSVVLFQYPFVNIRLIPFVLKAFKKHFLIGLVHDVNSVRVEGLLSVAEIKALACFDEIYVHTESMKAFFENNLPAGIRYKVLDCFPYLADKNKQERHLSKDICFAGNLNKSIFLTQFVQENKELNIVLYGSVSNPEKFNGKAQYLGLFFPDEIQNIKGSWGLVWDGECIDCCGRNYGEYLKIIAPHKFSMYLAAELPIIVWKESAMADIVEKFNLGITINSLSEISARIDALDDNYYQSILCSIRSYLNNCLNIVF